MAVYTCPNCGHVHVQATRARKRVPVVDVDTSSLTEAELFGHYKRTAPLEDVRFMLRVARMSDTLRISFEELEQAIVRGGLTNRAEIYRHYGRLQDVWRGESNRRERAERFIE